MGVGVLEGFNTPLLAFRCICSPVALLLFAVQCLLSWSVLRRPLRALDGENHATPSAFLTVSPGPPALPLLLDTLTSPCLNVMTPEPMSLTSLCPACPLPPTQRQSQSPLNGVRLLPPPSLIAPVPALCPS